MRPTQTPKVCGEIKKITRSLEWVEKFVGILALSHEKPSVTKISNFPQSALFRLKQI